MPSIRRILKAIFVLGPAVSQAAPLFTWSLLSRNDLYLPAGGLSGWGGGEGDHAAVSAASAPAPTEEPATTAAEPAAMAEQTPHAEDTAAADAAATPEAASTPASVETPAAEYSVAAAAAETPAATETPAAAETAAAAGGLSDVDILQFALTAEHLESEFYKQGFAKFPASDFKDMGLTDDDVSALQQIGSTEATHVSQLLSTIASGGTQPVAPCEYEFGLTDATTMLKTARTLEAVGVSAYLGAAPLISEPSTLSAAASILTVEGRHQTFIRKAAGAEPVPGAFDTALGPRAVFTLASQFIKSCPEGSSLNVQAFPAISLGNMEKAEAGQSLVLADPEQPAGAKFCAFMSNGAAKFSALANGNCEVPQGLVGETFMMVTSKQGITDDDILAGPSVLAMS